MLITLYRRWMHAHTYTRTQMNHAEKQGRLAWFHFFCLPFLLFPAHLHTLSVMYLSLFLCLPPHSSFQQNSISRTPKKHIDTARVLQLPQYNIISCKTNSSWRVSTARLRLVLSRAVSSRVLQSWNLYKPNEWTQNKWAIRLEIECIFTCRVDYDKTGGYAF